MASMLLLSVSSHAMFGCQSDTFSFPLTLARRHIHLQIIIIIMLQCKVNNIKISRIANSNASTTTTTTSTTIYWQCLLCTTSIPSRTRKRSFISQINKLSSKFSGLRLITAAACSCYRRNSCCVFAFLLLLLPSTGHLAELSID